ncbi:MAG: helix-turn-helix domain-containing protein, partial [Acidobacteriota bacterium]
MTTEILTKSVTAIAAEKNGGRRKAALFDDERAGRIYRTAAQMIYEKGFAATSMNEIAEAVELTKPGLYYYVKGKKELLFAIMGFAMDLLDVEVVAPAQEESDPEARLREIIRRHARLLTHEAGAVAILID